MPELDQGAEDSSGGVAAAGGGSAAGAAAPNAAANPAATPRSVFAPRASDDQTPVRAAAPTSGAVAASGAGVAAAVGSAAPVAPAAAGSAAAPGGNGRSGRRLRVTPSVASPQPTSGPAAPAATTRHPSQGRRERAPVAIRDSPLRWPTHCRPRRSPAESQTLDEQRVPRRRSLSPGARFGCAPGRRSRPARHPAARSAPHRVRVSGSRGLAVNKTSVRAAPGPIPLPTRLLLTAGRQKSGRERSVPRVRPLARHLVDCWSHLPTRGPRSVSEGLRGTL